MRRKVKKFWAIKNFIKRDELWVSWNCFSHSYQDKFINTFPKDHTWYSHITPVHRVIKIKFINTFDICIKNMILSPKKHWIFFNYFHLVPKLEYHCCLGYKFNPANTWKVMSSNRRDSTQIKMAFFETPLIILAQFCVCMSLSSLPHGTTIKV